MMEQNGDKSYSHCRGFTLVELLAVIAVIGIVAAILFPVFARSREKARQTICTSNQRQIGLAFLMYAHDCDGGLPPEGSRWAGCVYPYVKNTDVFRCPSDATDAQPPYYPVSYGLNGNLRSLTTSGASTKTVLLFEVAHSVAQITTPDEDFTAVIAPHYVSVAGSGMMLMSNGPFLRGDTKTDGGDEPVRYATGLMSGGTGPLSQEVFFEGEGRHQGGSDFLFLDGHSHRLAPERVSTGADAPAPESAPWWGYNRPPTAAGTENSRFAATFSTR